MIKIMSMLVASGLGLCCAVAATAGKLVTVDNFGRAHTDVLTARYVKLGGFAKFYHFREVSSPRDGQELTRLNRDTLYSIGTFDLDAGPVTIVKPDPGDRFQSMQVWNQDFSVFRPVEYGHGEFVFTRESVGTRYVTAVFRTFIIPNDPEDLAAANALQDKVQSIQEFPGAYEVPDWDKRSQTKVEMALRALRETRVSGEGTIGERSKLDKLDYLMGVAQSWGGNPHEAAAYDDVYPLQNDGKIPHSLTVKDVPVDAFWSVTIYNRDGYLEKNFQNAYSYNNLSAKKNDDGSVTINFGAGLDAVNNLPITPGWNYSIRMYRPHPEILDGTWTFPQAVPVE